MLGFNGISFSNLFAWIDPFSFCSPDEKVYYRRLSLFPDPEEVLFDFYGG